MFELYRNWRKLNQIGVLGINRRNAEFLLPNNPRRFFPLVDNKLRTKRMAQDAGIAVPDLLGVVETIHQVQKLPAFLEGFNDFVIKPASGSGGDGIQVITGKSGNRYRKASGDLLDIEEMKYHVSNILAGMYSLGGVNDIALIEERIEFDKTFERVTYQGVPDIRIIVYRGIPVMSMTRLPTRESDGKANLHQGAVGVGISIRDGITRYGVWHNELIHEHPDTGNSVTDIRVPDWDKLLWIAARCGEMVNLGYLGVDIALDRNLGPLLLELNARPGLNIQLANRTPLTPRLRKVDAIKDPKQMPMQDRIAFARENLDTPEINAADDDNWFFNIE